MTRPRTVQPLAFPSDAVLTIPGSKSEANRLLVAAALSGATVTVSGATPCEDVRHLVRGLRTLGFAASYIDELRGVVKVGPRRPDAPTSGVLRCGNAGTAVRFLVSVAAITPGRWTITGDAAMQRRPIQPLVDAWRQLGVEIDATDGCPPVRVRGGTGVGGATRVDASMSSQFVSSLLLVGAHLPGGLRVAIDGELASRSYAQLTCSLLARVGVRATLEAGAACVAPGPGAPGAELTVGGDWSGMGAWTCLNHLNGSRITADNLRPDSGQADEGLAPLLAQLTGDGDRTLDVASMPDQFLNLAVVAAFRRGATRLTGAENVRVKECDRVAVAVRELRRLGVDVDEHDDGLTVRGGRALRGGIVDPEGDHRVAMAFAIAGLLSAGVEVADPECVDKSYPTFWGDLERVRAQHRAVALIGMRAAGKTTLGHRIAAELGSDFVDTDAVFVERHGAIDAFVAANGWPAFRREEERIVADSLRAGAIVATGGGCVESAATRAVLRDHAVVVFLDQSIDALRHRLHGSSRPSLTGAPLVDELEEVFARREPLYRGLADRTVTVGNSLEETLRAVTAPPA